MQERIRKLLKSLWYARYGKQAIIGAFGLVGASIVGGCCLLSNTALEAYLEQRSQPTGTPVSQQYPEDKLSAILQCPPAEAVPTLEPGKIYVWKWEFRGRPEAPTFKCTAEGTVEPYPARVFWLLGNRILEEPEFPAKAYYLFVPGPGGEVPCESAGEWILQ